jgi:Fur family transcriptional regulator, peroxide stress response regulator
MKEEKKINDFIRICRENRLKITPQRLLIYKELINTKVHPNTDHIYSLVKKSFPNISFDTVYRTLLTFSQVGLADVIIGTGEPRRFDGNVKNHYHFRCLCCNEVYDIENGCEGEFKVPEKVLSDFELKFIKILFEGYCRKCSRSNRLN